MFFLKFCVFHVFQICLGQREYRDKSSDRPQGGGRKTPRPLPCVADPIIERKRRHLHGNQPSGGSTERWQDEDGGGMCCISWSLAWLSSSRMTLMTQKPSARSLHLLFFKKKHGGWSLLWSRALCVWRKTNSLHPKRYMERKHGFVYKREQQTEAQPCIPLVLPSDQLLTDAVS